MKVPLVAHIAFTFTIRFTAQFNLPYIACITGYCAVLYATTTDKLEVSDKI